MQQLIIKMKLGAMLFTTMFNIKSVLLWSMGEVLMVSMWAFDTDAIWRTIGHWGTIAMSIAGFIEIIYKWYKRGKPYVREIQQARKMRRRRKFLEKHKN